MTDEGKAIQPKSVVLHSPSYSEFLQRQLGIIDFNQGFNNFFSQMEASIKLIEEILIASEPRIITDPRTGEQINKNAIIDTVKHPELILDPVAVDNFKNIWNGGCYITKQRDPNNPTSFIKEEMRFHFNEKKLNPNDKYQEKIPLPALDNMMPTESTMKETWGIKISEGVPFRYAFSECDYDTIIRDGRFKFTVGMKTVAKFQPNEKNSLTKKTYRVGKPYYYRTIKLLKDKALREWSVIATDIHMIIDFLENGSDDDITTEHRTTSERERI